MELETGLARRDVVLFARSEQDVYRVLAGCTQPGDLVVTAKATSILVSRTAGPRGNQVQLAPLSGGDHVYLDTREFARGCVGRSVTFRRPLQRVVPRDPAVARAREAARTAHAAQTAHATRQAPDATPEAEARLAELRAVKPGTKGIAHARAEIAELEQALA